MISTKFTFNGVTSDSMGVYLVRTTTGLAPNPFVAGKEVQEEYPARADSPFFFRSKLQQYTLTMTFSTLSNNMTPTLMKSIANWLIKDKYYPFVSDDNPDKIFYLIAVNQINFMTNATNEGYFEVQFKSKYPYALTTASTPTHSIVSSGSFVLNNLSNVHEYYYPEMEITVNSGTSFTLTNATDANRATTITGLTASEIVYLNNSKKQLISSTGNYRYSTFNKNWFRLLQGNNTINVTGTVGIVFRTQFPVFT